MARSNLQEVQPEASETGVQPAATLAERLAPYANAVAFKIPLSLTDGMTVPVTPRLNAGETITLDADTAAFFSSAYLDAAKAHGESRLADAEWTGKSHADRQRYMTEIVNGGFVIPRADKNRTWNEPKLIDVVDELVFRLGQSQGKYPATAKYESQTEVGRQGRAGVVEKILTDPALADKYQSQVEALIAEKLAGRPVKTSRQKRGAVEVETATEMDIEV